MQIRTVAILGAGAIGGYFIWGLSEKMGENLWVIAEGERKERLERQGLEINGQTFPLHVRTPQQAKGADLLLVATKYGELTNVLDTIETITDPHTIVISLLNGVDSEEIIAKRIGEQNIVYGLMKIEAERRGHRITFNPDRTPGLFYGEKGQETPSPRVLGIEEMLRDTPLHYRVCRNIVEDMWRKFALNISSNQPQAILNCGIGANWDSQHVAYISRKLREEVEAIARAKGLDITLSKSEAGRKLFFSKRARYSTLQDLDDGRHTEVEMLAGAVTRMGRELGIETPYNEMTYHLIKALEEKNDGKFDYKEEK